MGNESESLSDVKGEKKVYGKQYDDSSWPLRGSRMSCIVSPRFSYGERIIELLGFPEDKL